jgi:hypothetical protein
MESDRSDQPEDMWLPGAHAATRPMHTWPAQPPPYWPPAYPPPAYPPPYGARYGRRVSNWTAAALIAGVAATTGYLAHAISGASGKAAGVRHHHKAPTTSGYAPAPAYVPPPVRAPVVTTGGSGGHGGKDN